MVVPARSQGTLPTQLNLIVVSGDGTINNVRQPSVKEPVIRVEDEGHKPVVGAAVVFTLPTEGATGTFSNGAKSLMVTTDGRGEAKAQGLKINRTNGKLPIHISASYRGLSARTIITQFNEGGVEATTRSGGGGHGVLIGVLVAVGAAAAGGGAYFATRKSNKNSTPVGPGGATPIGISPGTGSIAGGR
jgi:hypothetical protein